MITWAERTSGHLDGEAGGIKLFEIWPGVAEGDAPWTLNNELPGYYPASLIGKRVTSGDDLDEMKRSAEEILRGWIERVQGGGQQ